MFKDPRSAFLTRMLLWNPTLLRDVLIVLLCDRNPLIVAMVLWFDERNSVIVRKYLREYDKNLEAG
jgi:hypothetical protein